MKRVTVLMSRDDRCAFIKTLQTKYTLSQTEVAGVQNITTMGIGYLSIRMPNNETLVLEFLSDNRQRYGSVKLLESYIKDAEGVITSREIPEMFKAPLDKEQSEKIIFDINDFTDVSELMETIVATPTASQADDLGKEQAAPAASAGVLTKLWGLFSSGKSQQAVKRSEGVQDWQTNHTDKKAVNAGPSFRPHSSNGNDDL